MDTTNIEGRRSLDELVKASGLERRTVLGIIRTYEQITGDAVARVPYRNFLTPVLSGEQYGHLLTAIQSDDGRSYAEMFRALSGQPATQPRTVTVDAGTLLQLVTRLESLEKRLESSSQGAGANANANELLAQLDSLQKLINEATEFLGQRIENVGQRVSGLEQRMSALEQLVTQLIPFTHIVQGLPAQLVDLQKLVTQQGEQMQNFETQVRDDLDMLLQEAGYKVSDDDGENDDGDFEN